MKRLSQIALLAAIGLLWFEPSMAQVSGAGAGAAAKVTGILSTVLSVVQAVGITLFTLAMVFSGYKFAFVEGTKMADLKGVLIGGVIFGAASAIASFIAA